jgi:hypothetical protein
VRFGLGPIEFEFQVVAKKERSGDAKIGFHILAAEATIGGSGKGADERTQKVKLTLNPVLVDINGKRTKLEVGREHQPDAGQRKKSPLGRD